MTSLNRPARLNRTLLALSGLVLIAAGVFTLLTHSGRLTVLRPESALVAGTVAVPAFAQSPPAGNATSSPATHHTRAPMGTPSERNAALTDEGLVRASKLVGPSVYNYHDEKMAVLRRYPWKGEHGR